MVSRSSILERVHPDEDIGEPELLIDIVEAGGLDERVEDGGPLSAAIRAAEDPGFVAQRYPTQRALGDIVCEAHAPVIEESSERIPAPQHV